MKPILFFLGLMALSCSSCRWMNYKQIKGNGVMRSESRSISHAQRIKLEGSYDVEITQGPATSLKVEADENILPYILTAEENGYLRIRSKDHVSISSANNIKVFITTDKLEELHLSGSGNIIGKNKFTAGNKLTLKIAGSGDINMEVNTPDITADITGSGTITLKGETKNQTVHISGVGDYNADELKAESAKIKIAGSGNVKVFADMNLDVSIAGVGSVYYKGNPTIKQHVAGSGEVKKIE
jgi:hypothetical protein